MAARTSNSCGGNQFRVKDDLATVTALKDAGFPAHAEMLIGA
jgi:hypothetical protein